MANTISFWRGPISALPSAQDRLAEGLYFAYPVDGHPIGGIYLGSHLIAQVNDTDTSAVNGLISAALTNYYTQTQINNIIAGLDATKDSGTADLIKVTVIETDGKITSVTVDDSKLDAELLDIKTTIAGIVSTGGEANKVNDIQINGASIVANKIANISVASFTLEEGAPAGMQSLASKWYVDTADSQALSAAKGYTDIEITGLEFNLSSDGKTLELKNSAGTAIATLDTTKFVVDGMLSKVEADQTKNELVFTWNTDSGKTQTTTIPLSSIADIYTGGDGTTIKVTVSNSNVIWADVKEGSITSSHIAAAANIAKTQLVSTVQTSLDNADSALQSIKVLGHTLTKTNNEITVAQAKTALGLGTAAYSDVSSYKPVIAKPDTLTMTISVNGQVSEPFTVGWASEAINAEYATSAGYAAEAANAEKLEQKTANDFVQIQGNQNIAGTKTFSDVNIDSSLCTDYISQRSLAGITFYVGGPSGGSYTFINADDSTNYILSMPMETGVVATREYVKSTYIGNTNATLAEVVTAVNKLSTGAENTSTAIGAINSNVDAIISMLTWEEF